MKKGWKIFCGICAGMFVTGILLCIAAFFLGANLESIESMYPNRILFGFDSSSEKADKEDKGISFDSDMDRSYGNIRVIDVDIYAGELILEETEGTDVHVRAENFSKKMGFAVKEKDGTLCIRSRKNFFDRRNMDKGKIYIEIPKNRILEEVELDIGKGVLECGEIRCHEFSLNVRAGEAEISYISAEEADLDCGAGVIKASGNVMNININCGVGEVAYQATGREKEYNYDIDCGIGTVVCGSYEIAGIARKDMIDHGGERYIHIDCGVGEVTVTFEVETGKPEKTETYNKHHGENHHTENHL